MSRRTGVGVVLLLILVVGGGWSGSRYFSRRTPQVVQLPSLEPDEIRDLVGLLAKKRPQSFIRDIRVPTAQRLSTISLADAQQYGAIPALEKVAADRANPDAAHAAQESLAKIRGQ